MNHDHAIRLWNKLCEHDLAWVALTAGLKTSLNSALFREGQANAKDQKAVAVFLRKWADAIEGKEAPE